MRPLTAIRSALIFAVWITFAAYAIVGYILE